MQYRVSDCETGESRGFSWVAINPRNDKGLLVIFPPKCEVPEIIDTAKAQYKRGEGFFPFEESMREKGNPIYYAYGFQRMDFQAWCDHHVPRPEGCDITIEYSGYRADIRLSAQTFRKGRLETITKKIDTARDAVHQIREIYAYFERNCPAPTEQQKNSIAISGVGEEVLRACSETAIEMFKQWLAQTEKNAGYGFASLALDDAFCDIPKVEKITFSRCHEARQVLTKIEIAGGHVYDEDHKGATITLKVSPSAALVDGIKKKPLSAVIELPGADGMSIKNAREQRDEGTGGKPGAPYLVIRASLSVDILDIPEGRKESLEKIMSDLRDLMGKNGYFTTATEVLHNELLTLPPQKLRDVLALLKAGQNVCLDRFGLSNTLIKGSGKAIVYDYSPIIALPEADELFRLDKAA